MIIEETETLYSDWDESKYVQHELLVALSSVQFGAGDTNDIENGCFAINIIYGIELEGETLFWFQGGKQYIIPLKYSSIHFLAFLSEVFIKDFDKEFNARKIKTKLGRTTIKTRKIEDLYDSLEAVLPLIHLRAGTLPAQP
jgi:hypothetical protein